MRDRLLKALAWLGGVADARDAHFYGGLFIAYLGGRQLSQPWSLVAVGSALVLYSVLAPFFARQRKER